MKYDNYIFDLYGTLVDIHTDEESITFWRKIAGYVKREFGISFKPSELRKLYKEIYSDEVKKLAERLNAANPEIRISWVWDRILAQGAKENGLNVGKTCAEGNRETDQIAGTGTEADTGAVFGAPNIPAPLQNDGPTDNPSPEIQKLCTFFRETSRDKMELFPDTEKTLKHLHEEGKKVYLLSNAQRTLTWKEIEELGLEKYFDDIFISSDKLIMKPEKRFLEMLLLKHDLKKEKCVMIGNEIASDGEVARVNDIDGIIIKDGDFSKII